MTEKKVWELLAELVTSQKKIDTTLAKTDAKLAETSAKIDRVSERVSGISNNQVKIGEEFLTTHFKKNLCLQVSGLISLTRNYYARTRKFEKNKI